MRSKSALRMSSAEEMDAQALFTITINTMLGGAFVVEVAPSMTILSIKEMLAQIQVCCPLSLLSHHVGVFLFFLICT